MPNPWRPKVTANGWYPKLSPNGARVLYGFWETHVADLAFDVEVRIVSPTGARIHPLGWLDNTTIILGTETGPAAIYRVPIALIDWTVRFDDGDPAAVPPVAPKPIPIVFKVPESCNLNVAEMPPGFSWGNARGGHWGISLAGQIYNLKDGAPFRRGVPIVSPDGSSRIPEQYGIYVAGDHLVTMDKDRSILHFRGEELIREIPQDNSWVVNEQGDILTGYYGIVRCYPFDWTPTPGKPWIDATITPWKAEGIGAVPVRLNGDLWIWTFTALDKGGGVEETWALGRKLGETDPIIVRNFVGASGASDVVVVGEEFVIASNSPKGELEVRWVRIDTPREKLEAPAPAFPDVIPPKGPRLFAGSFTADDATPGNVTIWNGKGPIPAGKAIIATPDAADRVPSNRLLGIYVDTIANIPAARLVAERLRVPMFIYDESEEYGRVYPDETIDMLCGSTPWIAVPQWYVETRGREGESIASFVAEIAAQCADLAGRRVMPALRFHTGSGAIKAIKVAEALNALTAFADVCIGWLGFNWIRPGDGITDPNNPIRPYAASWLGVETTINPENARTWAGSLFTAAPAPVSIRITDYPKTGVEPFQAAVAFEVDAPADVSTVATLSVNGRAIIPNSSARKGTITARLDVAGTYAIAMSVVASNGSSDATAQPRTITVTKGTPMTGTGILKPGERIYVDRPLYSQDGRFFVRVEANGDATINGPGFTAPLFKVSIAGAKSIDMQGDGNLVPYDAQGRVCRDNLGRAVASHTSGNPGAWFIVQNDRNGVIYGAGGPPLWASGTIEAPPVPGGMTRPEAEALVFAAYRELLTWAGRPDGKPDPYGLEYYATRLMDGRMTDATMRDGLPDSIKASAEYKLAHPPAPPPGVIVPVEQIRVVGKVFRYPDGRIYNSRGASGFLDLRRLLEGDEVGLRSDLKRWYAIGNRERRVFSRVDWNGTPGPGLFPERYGNYWPMLDRYYVIAAEEGFYVEIVALTGNMAGGLDAMADWCNRIEASRRRHVNVFHQLTNEPPVNGIDIEGLVARLDTSGWSQPWDTGQYYPTAEPAGSYCSPHTDRVDGWDWVRKAMKDILEYRDGGGPYNETDPKMDRPIRGGEPMGAASFYIPGRRDNVPVHHYTAAAGSHLFGSGYCVHGESGLNSVFPSGVELECVTAAFRGMDAVGPEWQLGQYSRVGLAEFPIIEDRSVRTYGMFLNGRWKVVRVGPETPLPDRFAPGWRVEKVDTFAGLNVVLELGPG